MIYRGDGILEYQVPTLPEGAMTRLWFKDGTGNNMSGLFLGRGSIFRDMIRNAFPGSGGITLNGHIYPLTEKDNNSPVFRTVIQPDADVICQVDLNILGEHNYRQLLSGYDQVSHQFLEAFRNRIRFQIMQIIAVSGVCLSLWELVGLITK